MVFGTKYVEAVDNTAEIAEKCNLSIDFGTFKFPDYEIPTCVKTIEEFLRKLVYMGFDRRYPHGLTENMLREWNMNFLLLTKWDMQDILLLYGIL